MRVWDGRLHAAVGAQKRVLARDLGQLIPEVGLVVGGEVRNREGDVLEGIGVRQELVVVEVLR